MNTLADLARVTTPTVGTGTLVLGPPVTGYLSFAAAGVPDGAVVSYGIADAGQSETGAGTYDATALTLTRSVYRSTGAGNNSPIPLSGAAQVFITVLAADLMAGGAPWVQKAGDTMTGSLVIQPSGSLLMSAEADQTVADAIRALEARVAALEARG
jgi:hypothetical protein